MDIISPGHLTGLIEPFSERLIGASSLLGAEHSLTNPHPPTNKLGLVNMGSTIPSRKQIDTPNSRNPQVCTPPPKKKEKKDEHTTRPNRVTRSPLTQRPPPVEPWLTRRRASGSDGFICPEAMGNTKANLGDPETRRPDRTPRGTHCACVLVGEYMFHGLFQRKVKGKPSV